MVVGSSSSSSSNGQNQPPCAPTTNNATAATDRQLRVDEDGNEVDPDDVGDDDGEEAQEGAALDPRFRDDSVPDGDIAAPVLSPNGRTYLGPRNIPAGTTEPAHFMELLFSDAILDRFVLNTNTFVAQETARAWEANTALTREELKRFFGLILYMGVVQHPARPMFWSNDIFGDPYVKSIMSRDRFMAISQHLHWLDASDISDDERKRRKTGYLLNFFMYRGKDEHRPPGMSATLWPVVKLTQPTDFHNMGYYIATDNWSTSLDTVQHLKKPPTGSQTSRVGGARPCRGT